MARISLPSRLPFLVAACGLAVVTSTVGAAHAATASPSVPSPPSGLSRVAGSDRYLTGVLVSQSQWADVGGDTTGRAQAQAVVPARRRSRRNQRHPRGRRPVGRSGV